MNDQKTDSEKPERGDPLGSPVCSAPPRNDASAATILTALAAIAEPHSIYYEGIIGRGRRRSQVRGRTLGVQADDDQPFQDSRGRWYVRSKGTIRRLKNYSPSVEGE